MIENINIGTFIYETFNLIVGFFLTLYKLLSVGITIPQFVADIINSIFPNLQLPETISILSLLAVTGVPIALAIGIYYIFKGPV